MKERLRRYYLMVRSVRPSTWMLVVIAIASTVLYYQVRPEPPVQPAQVGDTTVPVRDTPLSTETRPRETRPAETTTTHIEVPSTQVTGSTSSTVPADDSASTSTTSSSGVPTTSTVLPGGTGGAQGNSTTSAVPSTSGNGPG